MKIAKALGLIICFLGLCLGLLSFPSATTWGVEYAELPGIKDYNYLNWEEYSWKPPYTVKMLF